MNDVPIGAKVTPLYGTFKNLNASFTEFGGYYMPVHISGIIAEHLAVRNQSGLFDISHMGEISLTGKDASKFLNYVSTNNIDKCADFGMQYQILCHDDGGAIDDMMAYKYNSESIYLVCNASNQDEVFNHLVKINETLKFDVKIVNEGERISAIAVQGPMALEQLKKVMDIKDLTFMTFEYDGKFIVSRSGYTGEDGFEIYGGHEDIVDLTHKLLKVGVVACGLGSRDTLRFEAGLPLYGHELTSYINPIQAGLGFAVDFDKETFIGKEPLLREKTNKPEKRVFGMILLDKGIARQGYDIYDGDKWVGYITSGFMIPGTKDSYANGLIDSSYKIGDEVEIEIRNKRVKARLRKKSYIKKNYARWKVWDITQKQTNG